MTIQAAVSIPTKTHRAFANQWAHLLAGDEGEAIDFAQYTDKSVQVSGTFGGASVHFKGSNDGVNWNTLRDAQGNTLNFITADTRQVAEATVHVKPVVVGGDGTTDITVTTLMKE